MMILFYAGSVAFLIFMVRLVWRSRKITSMSPGEFAFRFQEGPVPEGFYVLRPGYLYEAGTFPPFDDPEPITTQKELDQ